MPTVSVRYIVDDVDAAIEFYCRPARLPRGHAPRAQFAMLSRGDLRLVLSAPGGGPGGGQAMPDGTMPAPGGWNRFQLEVDDIDGDRRRPARARRHFRNDIVAGVGGKQILVEDPGGQPDRAVRADAARGEAVVGADRNGLVAIAIWAITRT